PRYEREGKSYLTVGVGCTGGRHRSVACAEWLAKRMSELTELRIEAVHRDIDRVNHEAVDAQGDRASETDSIGGGPRGGEGTF
ncbi:MAG: hypothetical protein KC492_29915, partial [Myxococcales bacterium]|nr:hypothetical protein [Myxococcales bacterium]